MLTTPDQPRTRSAWVGQLNGRLDHVRQLGRIRRRRFQLPLSLAGSCVSLGGIVASSFGISVGTIGATIGPWLLLLSVLPNQFYVIGIALAMLCLLSVGATITATLTLLFPCPAQNSASFCATLYGVRAYAVAVLVFATVRGAFLSVAFLRHARGLRRWPALPPRAALETLHQSLGLTFISYAPVWLAYGVLELREPWGANAESVLNWRLSRSVQVTIYFTTGALVLGTGCLSRWKPLRTSAQAWLASMGEGVATAAGIAELIGEVPTKSLVAFSEQTLRSVRLKLVQPRHLARDEHSGSEMYHAYSLSTPAPLGSIDAFISHSWRDSADDKFAALQLWRERFVRANGREPTVWIDRCCLDPQKISAQLLCLPIYCSSCDQLLALRGPTFLDRLWCIVEIYIFYEMTADPHSSVSARIEIIDLKDTPLYTSEGCVASETAMPPPISAAPGLIAASLTRPRVRSSRPVLQRFDVRKTTCEAECDKEKLLAVIEGIGAGFERFNEWMHNLLVAGRARTPREAAIAASRYPGRLRHFGLPRAQQPAGGASPANHRPPQVHPANMS